MIDWSYDLLCSEERVLLHRLSVFAGGWTLEAAERICAGGSIEEWEILDLLTQLVSKSLVVYEEPQAHWGPIGERSDDHGTGEARYRLLEIVRQYSRDRLEQAGEEEELRERQRDFFLTLVERAEPELWGPAQRKWLDRLEAEHDNVRAALGWSVENGEAATALRLAGAMNRY